MASIASPEDSGAESRNRLAQLNTNRGREAHAATSIDIAAPRWDAVRKVRGEPLFAADQTRGALAHAVAITSPVARGTIRSADTAAARGMPGILSVYTHLSMQGRLRSPGFVAEDGFGVTSLAVMTGPDVLHAGQIIGLVVAETPEQAAEAAASVVYVIDRHPASARFGDSGVTVIPAAADGRWQDPQVGDVQHALDAAAHATSSAYDTPTQHHNPIELFSTTCAWEGDRLTIEEPSAGVEVLKRGVARQLGIDPDQVLVSSPWVGGSFGAKVNVTPRTAPVALAARDLGRPVRCVLSRAQGFTQSTYRAETRHEVDLGCDAGGRMTAYRHHARELTSRTDRYSVKGAGVTANMYGWEAIDTAVEIVEADRSTPGFMRAPAETPYMFALESAIDELAAKANLDPVEFRIVNDNRISRWKGRRFSSRALVPCLRRAAEAFGWSRRDAEPGSMRDGDWLVGYGVASTCYPTKFSPSDALVRLLPDGHAEVEVGAHEIGNGAYGVAATIAAQELGLAPERIRVRLGRSDLPAGPVAGSSRITASMGNAVALACHHLRRKLGTSDGASVADDLPGSTIEARATWTPPGAPADAVDKFHRAASLPIGGEQGDMLRYAFGAQCVEVRVHRITRRLRVTRAVGAFAAGRIVNETTARSQLLGGMVWGISSALFEATELDPATATYLNTDLADYLIPTCADIETVEALLLPEDDPETNELGIKGIGELGIVGTAAAVCNAVWHATGRRVRRLPVRIEDLL